MDNLRSINSIVETLAKVENKALWANSIKRTQPVDEQAKVFFESYRIQLTKEEEMKDKIERLKQSLKEQERKTMLLEMTVADKKKYCEKLRKELAN